MLKKCLPGPYTFLLTRGKNLPKLLKDKRQVVGVRIPDSELITDIVRALGHPLASSSLPVPQDGIPLVYGYEIENKFGHQLDVIFDLGEPMPNDETTIIDLSSGELELIRQGKGPFPLQDF